MKNGAAALGLALSALQKTALHVGPGNGLPHDPLALVLYARACEDPSAGFAAASLSNVVASACPSSLALGPAPGADRSLTEASGSFGGLTLPGNVAMTPDGSVFLVDATHGVVKYFDACDCAFKPVPCFTRTLGAAPTVCDSGTPAQRFVPLTELAAPGGMTIAGTSLLIADTGHHRVIVVNLIGWVPNGALRLPKATGLRRLWRPFAVAVDSRRTVYVSDPDHARIDIFGPDGRWRRAWQGLGAVTHLAVDCDDTLLAVIGDYGLDAKGNPVAAAVEIVDGVRRVIDGGPAEAAERLPPAPLPVDRAGRLNLSAVCQAPAAVFDLDGYAVAAEKKAAAAIYAASGTYASAALDSRRLGCVWHRVVLAGAMPERATLSVQTTTSDVELDAGELADLAPEQWSPVAVIRCMTRGVADALILSPPGRYLWLRLVLSGDGMSTPAVTRIVVEFPRVSLRRFLPGVYGMDPSSADFTDRFTSLFDTTLRSIENRVDTFYELFDARTAPAERPAPRVGSATYGIDFLSWLASWIGMPLSRLWPEAVRRAMLRAAACYFTLRGTRTGLRTLLLTFLGFHGRACEPSCSAVRCEPRPLNCAPPPAPCKPADPPLILEHFRLRRWLFLGAGRLGDDAMLWGKRIVNRSQLSGPDVKGNARLGPLVCPPDRQPATRLYSVPDPARDPFFEYAYKFTVFVPARVKSREWQRRGLEQLLAGEAPAHTQWNIEYVEPRFRVGVQALIGFDSVIARVPHGIRLNDNRLGQGTVLPPQPGRRARVGIDARVGESVRL